jgi:FixJ family two-component response regulator
MSDEYLIVIIDDDRPFLESLRRLIRSLGYAVDVFPSAADFLASSRLREASCLIADVNMPSMTGFELFRHLVQIGHPIPTILVTAYPTEADRARAMKEGVICYLRKPIDEPTFSRCLRVALRTN